MTSIQGKRLLHQAITTQEQLEQSHERHAVSFWNTLMCALLVIWQYSSSHGAACRDMEMALRDLSVSSMKHPALAKESASYTTLEMPTDIVIIPVGHLSCAGPANAGSSAHPVSDPLATDVYRLSSRCAQNGHDPAQHGGTPQVLNICLTLMR